MPIPAGSPLSIQELTGVLIKHYGIRDGNFDLLVEFQIGMGAIGPSPDDMKPSAIVGVNRIGLVPAQTITPLTVNASVVNPIKKKTSKK